MGRPELCCVFCHTPVQQMEEGHTVLEDYLDIWPNQPICAECVSAIVQADLRDALWRLRRQRKALVEEET